MSEKQKYVTVVYEIVNHDEWGKSNPLRYEHNGLKSTGVSLGDLMERVETLEQLLNENDIYIP